MSLSSTRLLAALVVVLSACGTPPPKAPVEVSRESRRAALHVAGSFAAILSERAELDDLADFDVVILDPDAYESEDLSALRGAGVVTLGYVNIGEIEDWRSHAQSVDPAWVLGENPAWPGHQFVDARQPGWRRLVVEVVAQNVIAKEFDGLFLDMADVAAPALFPETADGVVSLVEALREVYPTHALVMNRGLFLLDRLEPTLDGLLVEGVWARLDPDGAYVRTSADDTDVLVTALRRMREAGGGAFAVDYADTDRLRAHALDAARRARLPVYVGRRALGGPEPLARTGW
ncbi:endo alpha-1,4 polygalactosaminidase [Rubrivirga sp. IMCC43871]|uniref:endo alpha-1,4 polygalactosaminidase n=1 Tax=Rubrivirga sp. IMCC43871 TaxID=3391575 RepID=UPI00398FDC49